VLLAKHGVVEWKERKKEKTKLEEKGVGQISKAGFEKSHLI
jgi:hypothetical protein